MLDVTIEPKPLLAALRLVAGAADAEKVDGWYAAARVKRVRLEAAAGRLTLSAFSREVGQVAATLAPPAAAVARDGVAAVEPTKFAKGLATARPADACRVRGAKDDGVVLQVGPAKLAFDLPADDLLPPPAPPAGPPVRVYAWPLAAALRRAAKTVAAVVEANTRFDLTRVSVELAGAELTVSGSDNVASATTVVAADGQAEAAACLLPAGAAVVLAQVLDDAKEPAEVWVAKGALTVRAGGLIVAAAALTGRPFPRPAAPPDDQMVAVAGTELIAALRMTAAAGGEEMGWAWDGERLTLLAQEAEYGLGETVVTAAGPAPAASGRVDGRRLLGLLDGLGGTEVSLGLPAGGAAVVVRAGGFTGILAQLGA